MTAVTPRATLIAPGVHRIDSPLLGRVVSLFLFVGPSGALLFDTGVLGTTREWLIPALDEIGVDPSTVRWVVVSHCDVDHFGGIGEITEALPAAQILAHVADAPAMDDFETFLADRGAGLSDPYGMTPSDEAIEWMRSVLAPGVITERITEREFDLGNRRVRALHTPGHSNGHLSLYDPDTGVLAISDAILGAFVPYADGSPAFPPTYRHEVDYFDTIARVRALAPTALATAHNGVFTGAGITEFLDVSEAFAHMLRAAVRAEVAARPEGVRLGELSRALTHLGVWPLEDSIEALAMPIAGHVEQWVAEGGAVLDASSEGAIIRPV